MEKGTRGEERRRTERRRPERRHGDRRRAERRQEHGLRGFLSRLKELVEIRGHSLMKFDVVVSQSNVVVRSKCAACGAWVRAHVEGPVSEVGGPALRTGCALN